MVDLIPEDPRVTWILFLAILVAFLLAFSVGANDVSNSYGTSVGSGVLTVTQACILATFFEVAGAALLGQTVCDFFRKNMYEVKLYDGSQDELMLGALGCLVGSAIWNFVATKLKMPISGTHSVIGATLGFNLVLRGFGSIQWKRIGMVVASWFVSPIMSGIISSIIFLIISKKIIAETKPLDNGLKALPLFYGLTIFINVASLTINGPDIFGLNQLPWYAGLAIALTASALTICYTAIRIKPRIRTRIEQEMNTSKNPVEPKLPSIKIGDDGSETKDKDENNDDGQAKQSVEPQPVKQSGPKLIAGERLEVFRLFSSLQILTACFASFAHGTNDVSNAVAPLVPIWNVWEQGKEDTDKDTQVWLLLFGGIGICAGLWAWGRAVMRTVGTGLTQLTPSKGFSIELGAAISVLFASKIGIPISTTHCKVGSLVILGMVSDRFCSQDSLQGLSRGTRRISRLWAEGILSEDEDLTSGKVDWKLFGNIAITWIVTVPLSALAAAIATVILRAIAPSLS